LRDPAFSHFGTVGLTACDRQTDGHTTTAYTAVAYIASRVKMCSSYLLLHCIK